MEPHIYDFDRSKINHLEKTTQRSTKLMQLNYIHIMIFELKIYSSSLFGHIFWARVTWWQDFATFIIQVFSLPLFLNAKSPVFVVCFIEKLPELIKDLKGYLLLQSNKIVKWENFVPGIKIFTQNKLIISIADCVDILANIEFARILSCFDSLRYFFLTDANSVTLCYIYMVLIYT